MVADDSLSHNQYNSQLPGVTSATERTTTASHQNNLEAQPIRHNHDELCSEQQASSEEFLVPLEINHIQISDTKIHEISEGRHLRRKRERACKGVARVQDAFDQHEYPLQSSQVRMNAVRQQETPDQYRIRLQKSRLRMSISRQNETLVQRQIRLHKDRMRIIDLKQNESPEERELRLSKVRKRANLLRQKETTEKREARLLKNRILKRVSRQKETTQEKILRRKKDKICHANSRTQEKPEQRDVRRERDKIRHAIARQQETVEQRQARHSQDQIRHALIRQQETSDRRMQEGMKSVRMKYDQNDFSFQCEEIKSNEHARLSAATPEFSAIDYCDTVISVKTESEFVRADMTDKFGNTNDNSVKTEIIE